MEVMFQNKNYKVVANTDRKVYELVNKISGFTELFDEVFPKMMMTADEFNRRIENLKATQLKENRSGAITLAKG